MIVYLAAFDSIYHKYTESLRNVYLLSSFIEHKNSRKRKLYVTESNHLLDSGAFTYMQGTDVSKINWDKYIEEYARFINEMGIDLFMELDIDVVVGLSEVERLRRKLEKLTNKRSIPVWHKSRGKKYWIEMTQAYDYVALGGIVSGGIKYRNEIEKIFPWFLDIAKKNNCKVHALGYTPMKGLQKYAFDSVDSTSWINGGKFGTLYYFNGKKIVRAKKPKGLRVRQSQVHPLHIHNFKEWIKFQKYAKERL